jgi:hypothetical protein
MSLSYSIVGFKDVQIEDVERSLREEWGDRILSEAPLGLHISVRDSAAAYRTADHFQQETGIQESNPFLREFDILPFAAEVHVSCSRGRAAAVLLEELSELIALSLSRRLKTQALVRVADGEIPFRLYDAGAVSVDYLDRYRDFLSGRRWIPRELGHSS